MSRQFGYNISSKEKLMGKKEIFIFLLEVQIYHEPISLQPI